MQYPDISWFFFNIFFSSRSWISSPLGSSVDLWKNVDTSSWGACVQCFSWRAALQLFAPWMLQHMREHTTTAALGLAATCKCFVSAAVNTRGFPNIIYIYISDRRISPTCLPNKFLTNGIQWLDPSCCITCPHSIKNSLFVYPWIPSFINSWIHSFIHAFIHSVFHAFIPSYAQSFMHSFSQSCIQSITHSLTHSFIHTWRVHL